ncbi:cyclic nucleotide-binding domain-containing protein [Candidatus Magnetominusculus dajiuhuensis]|uniref:cyclic nucleotide-binding domain-containing protein n=1 Tax=Candidatus Magnetominusculus dajiuhuensis TaxID=3137712 RepID=UPI003B43C605
MPVLAELKRQMLLDGLDEAELQSVAQVVEPLSFPRGDSVFRENEPTLGVYLIRSGEVEISRKLPIDLKTKMLITVRNTQNCCEIRKTPYGWRQVFAKLLDGQFFGELSVIEGKKKHGADAEVIEDAELYLIRSDKFAEIEASAPSTMLKILRVVARVSSKNMRYLDKQLLRLLIGI